MLHVIEAKHSTLSSIIHAILLMETQLEYGVIILPAGCGCYKSIYLSAYVTNEITWLSKGVAEVFYWPPDNIWLEQIIRVI